MRRWSGDVYPPNASAPPACYHSPGGTEGDSVRRSIPRRLGNAREEIFSRLVFALPAGPVSTWAYIAWREGMRSLAFVLGIAVFLYFVWWIRWNWRRDVRHWPRHRRE